jgi:hypothetical protein
MLRSWNGMLCQEYAKLSSKQSVATLKNLKYKTYVDLFNTFLMSSLLFCNVENSKNKEKPLNE